MNNLKKEALKYDLGSLIRLQEKRKENIILFEQSIKNERNVSQQEEGALNALEAKLRQHDLGINLLSDTDKEWILSDIPKLKSTRQKREQTISLLKEAIIQEQGFMDNEEYMIKILESVHDGKE